MLPRSMPTTCKTESMPLLALGAVRLVAGPPLSGSHGSQLQRGCWLIRKITASFKVAAQCIFSSAFSLRPNPSSLLLGICSRYQKNSPLIPSCTHTFTSPKDSQLHTALQAPLLQPLPPLQLPQLLQDLGARVLLAAAVVQALQAMAPTRSLVKPVCTNCSSSADPAGSGLKCR